MLVIARSCQYLKDEANSRSDCIKLHSRLTNTLKDRAVGTVFWAQRWDKQLYDLELGLEIGDLAEGGHTKFVESAERFLDMLGGKVNVVIVGSVPGAAPASNQMRKGYLRCLRSFSPCVTEYDSGLRMGKKESEILERLASSRDNVIFFDPAKHLCSGEVCRILQDGRLIYSDHAHLTEYGAMELIKGLSEAISVQPL